MPCYHPLKAWKTPGGGITFNRSQGYLDKELKLACGQCRGCRLEYAREWAVRIMHEAQMHEENSFITLTYNNKSLPEDGGLKKSDFTNFAKKFRRDIGPFRYYQCGEYGEENMRAHHHSAMFGHSFKSDRRYIKKTKLGYPIYRSQILEDVWGKGRVFIGDLTFESASYVARYIMKKQTGEEAHIAYGEQVKIKEGTYGTFHVHLGFQHQPEYSTMSRRPGIGSTWLDQYHKDVYPSDEVIIRGRSTPTPKYYDRWLESRDPLLHRITKIKRIKRGEDPRVIADNTPDRLAIREEFNRAKMRHFSRSL